MTAGRPQSGRAAPLGSHETVGNKYSLIMVSSLKHPSLVVQTQTLVAHKMRKSLLLANPSHTRWKTPRAAPAVLE